MSKPLKTFKGFTVGEKCPNCGKIISSISRTTHKRPVTKEVVYIYHPTSQPGAVIFGEMFCKILDWE